LCGELLRYTQRNMSGNSAFTVFMIFVIDMDRKPSYWTIISRNVNSYTTFQSISIRKPLIPVLGHSVTLYTIVSHNKGILSIFCYQYCIIDTTSRRR